MAANRVGTFTLSGILQQNSTNLNFAMDFFSAVLVEEPDGNEKRREKRRLVKRCVVGNLTETGHTQESKMASTKCTWPAAAAATSFEILFHVC